MASCNLGIQTAHVTYSIVALLTTVSDAIRVFVQTWYILLQLLLYQVYRTECTKVVYTSVVYMALSVLSTLHPAT